MKISVITVSYNTAPTIEDTFRSVDSQTYRNIEHIVIDGGSDDGTVDCIRRHENALTRWITEPDKGIYDAMNKGIAMSTGDIIGFLNADDIYADTNILAQIAQTFEPGVIDACYGDLVYFRSNNFDKVVRYFCSRTFSPSRLAYGQMPAHPTLYLRKNMFEKYGLFKTDYEIAADYELVTRMFAKTKIHSVYLPLVMVKMRTGGISTRSWKSNLKLNLEILRACKENGVSTNILKVYSKYPAKLLQMFNRPL